MGRKTVKIKTVGNGSGNEVPSVDLVDSQAYQLQQLVAKPAAQEQETKAMCNSGVAQDSQRSGTTTTNDAAVLGHVLSTAFPPLTADRSAEPSGSSSSVADDCQPELGVIGLGQSAIRISSSWMPMNRNDESFSITEVLTGECLQMHTDADGWEMEKEKADYLPSPVASGPAFGRVLIRTRNLRSHQHNTAADKRHTIKRRQNDGHMDESAAVVEHVSAEVKSQFRRCPHCPKLFTHKAKAMFEFHVSTHTGERPYRCPKCECAFGLRSNLIRHMNHQHKSEKAGTDTGERPCRCPKCECAYTQSHSLAKHMKSQHGIEVEKRRRSN